MIEKHPSYIHLEIITTKENKSFLFFEHSVPAFYMLQNMWHDEWRKERRLNWLTIAIPWGHTEQGIVGDSNNCLENNAMKNGSDMASADLCIVLQAAAHADH